MRKLFGLLALVCLVSGLSAQNDVHYTMFMFNKLSINPAYAGSRDVMTFTGHYRNQWQGITGAPRTFSFNMHTPFFKKRCGLGLSVVADKIGMVNTYDITGAYAYRMNFGDGKVLSVGVDGQMQYGRVDWSLADPVDLEDGLLPEMSSSKLNPNFGMGVYYNTEKYYVGFSIPKVLKTTIYDDDPIGNVGLNSLRSYYFMGGLMMRLNKNIRFQPGALVTINPNTPFEIDLNTNFVFMDRLLLGASYRLQDSFGAIVQFQVSPQLRIALAGDYTLTELRDYSPGSWEIMIEYSMNYEGGKLNNLRYF